MSFQRPAGITFFTATISDSNAAFLDGTTVPLAEYASVATTLPLDLDLWHRRLAHHHYEGVKKLLKKKLVTASFPALNAEVENTPSVTPAPVTRPSSAVPKQDSNPYYFPPDSDDSDSDSDDESSSDESLLALQHLLQLML